MATLTITFPANTGANDAYNTGAQIRAFARKLERAAAGIPDRQSTGASTTLVFDDTASAPSPGFVTVTHLGVATVVRL